MSSFSFGRFKGNAFHFFCVRAYIFALAAQCGYVLQVAVKADGVRMGEQTALSRAHGSRAAHSQVFHLAGSCWTSQTWRSYACCCVVLTYIQGSPAFHCLKLERTQVVTMSAISYTMHYSLEMFPLMKNTVKWKWRSHILSSFHIENPRPITNKATRPTWALFNLCADTRSIYKRRGESFGGRKHCFSSILYE